MFDRKTVFILGAGASWHYNYPTGADLVGCIRSKIGELVSKVPDYAGVSFFNDLSTFVSTEFLGEEMDSASVISFLNNFGDRLKHVDPPVIDYFLDWNPDLQEIGQMMIAWVILDREREFEQNRYNGNHQRLRDKNPEVNGRQKLDGQQFNDNWYRFVLYKMLSNCSCYEEFATGNNVHFVTFNYDVSLETYLYKGLKQIQFMKSGDMDADKIKNCLVDKFTHLYGSLREEPYHDPVSTIRDLSQYSDILPEYVRELKEVHAASKGIRTIASLKGDDSLVEAARQKIKEAEDIYILGYGFDENNNERLNLNGLLSQAGINKWHKDDSGTIKKNVYFTNFGDHNSVNKKASKALTGKATEFLQDKSPIYAPRRAGSFYHIHTYYEKSTKNVYDALEQDFDFI